MRCSAAAHLHAISKSLKAVRSQLSAAARLIKLKQVPKSQQTEPVCCSGKQRSTDLSGQDCSPSLGTLQYTSQKAKGPNKHQLRHHTGQITSSPPSPPASLPRHTREVSKHPSPPPNPEQFSHFFFLNAKNSLRMQTSPKETQATYKNRRHDKVLH